jgi:polyisoprenoid-binding protein YceI
MFSAATVVVNSIVANARRLHMSIVAETPVTVLPAGTWSIDPAHSVVEFRVKHLGIAPVTGRAPVVSGTIEGGETPSVEGTVDATSITTFEETRDGHLQSPDFFDTERYPELRFESTRVESRDGEVVVEGNLTIRGVTRPVELRGTFGGSGVDPWGNDRIALELSTTIDRTEWGLVWNAPLPGGGFLLPDDVELRASFSAIRKA